MALWDKTAGSAENFKQGVEATENRRAKEKSIMSKEYVSSWKVKEKTRRCVFSRTKSGKVVTAGWRS